MGQLSTSRQIQVIYRAALFTPYEASGKINLRGAGDTVQLIRVMNAYGHGKPRQTVVFNNFQCRRYSINMADSTQAAREGCLSLSGLTQREHQVPCYHEVLSATRPRIVTVYILYCSFRAGLLTVTEL